MGADVEVPRLPIDIIQLARLSSRLSASFSSGPTGAVSEFHEVKSQLSSLSVVLEALAKETGRPGRSAEDVRNKEKLGEMVEGCRASLHRLESIVEKYTDKLDSSWSWKIWFSKGYKLILWTTDGGDIKALREDLHRHYVMIDSYINVLNRADLQQALDVLDRMLTEKAHRRTLSSGSRPQNHPNSVLRPEATHISSSTRPKTFEGFPPFFASSDAGYRRIAKTKMNFSISLRNPMTSVCREATVNPNFFIGGSIISNQPLFCCNCSRIMQSVGLQDSHHAALAKIKCGPGTIIVKNESSDLLQREYTLYAPRIDEPEPGNKSDSSEGRSYTISIPLRKNERLFEASLVQFLSRQAARCLADSVIPESKWVRWENDVPISPPAPSSKNDLYSPWSSGHGARASQSKPSRGRVLVACSVRLGITAESTINSMNIKYLPPNNSNWSETVPVKSVMIIQYRSIRKQKLYNSEDYDDASEWQDGDYLKLYLDFAKVSEYLKETKSLRCDFVWEEKLRVMGPAVTLKVRSLRHFEDDVPVEGSGTLTYLGERITLCAGAGSSAIQLDRWNLPKVPTNRRAVTDQSASLVAWTQPLHEQLRNFWAARASRREETKATFPLNNIAVRGRPDIFGQEFYNSYLVVLHDKTTRSTRLVLRSASGSCVITQNVSERKWTKLDLQEDTLSVEEPLANITTLVPGRGKDGPSLNIRQEPNTLIYQFANDQDAVACICMITELARSESVIETMALDDAISGPASGISTPAISEPTEPAPPAMDMTFQSPRNSSLFLSELPSNHVRKTSSGQAQNQDTLKEYDLDLEIYLDESHRNILCPHATVNPALFLSFDAIGPASLPLFSCRCRAGKGPQGLVKQHELGEYRAGAFTLPILALGSRTTKNPGCFVIVNASAKGMALELYIRCPRPQKERQFEEIMAGLLRRRVAINLAIVGMRSNPDLISVHTEDADTISILSAFGNIEISPSADIRVDGNWKFLSKSVREVSISQYQVVRRWDLAERLTQDPGRHGNFFEDSGKSKLQFKCDDKNYTCYVRTAPKLHTQHDYVTLTMDVEGATLLSDDRHGYASTEDYLGSGRLRLRFDGAGKATKLVASQGFGWFTFWRNRLNMRRWFDIDEDEEKEYETGIEETEVENDNPRFFDGFFNNSKLSLLRNDEMNTIRILVESFQSDRILSQYVTPAHFTREGSIRASIDACCIGERTLVLPHDSAIAERPEDGNPRCWPMSGAASYMFPTKQMRDTFCDSLARVINSIGKVPGQMDEGIFELDTALSSTPNAVELPTFEFSMPTLLRRATITRKIHTEVDENDYSDPDADPGLDSQFQSPRSSNIGLSEPQNMVRPSRSFVRERRPSPVRAPENTSRRTTPSPKPVVFIPPPPPLPSFPKELTASPVETRIPELLSSPPRSLVSSHDTVVASPTTSFRSATSSRTFIHSRSPSRSTTTTYRVWADYDATENGEIDVRVGDMIKVDYEKDEEDAVWGVKMHTKSRLEGWVPKWCLTQVGNLDFNTKGRRRQNLYDGEEWGV
ncbi:hypothetical protein DRE_04315 [Drechslerella stenobrocha 248]|uniref:SH3 domain-containing protein n=1 Tax=Drechslerella stenobrocha 248 TaxID=1043628 RepID=W7I1I6_9PEZI|nr:hypothetical protein DRE_04315 [Drechslerella stenobrocha 248]